MYLYVTSDRKVELRRHPTFENKIRYLLDYILLTLMVKQYNIDKVWRYYSAVSILSYFILVFHLIFISYLNLVLYLIFISYFILEFYLIFISYFIFYLRFCFYFSRVEFLQ